MSLQSWLAEFALTFAESNLEGYASSLLAEWMINHRCLPSTYVRLDACMSPFQA